MLRRLAKDVHNPDDLAAILGALAKSDDREPSAFLADLAKGPPPPAGPERSTWQLAVELAHEQHWRTTETVDGVEDRPPLERVVCFGSVCVDMDERKLVARPPLGRSEVRQFRYSGRASPSEQRFLQEGVLAERGDGAVLAAGRVELDEGSVVRYGPLRWRPR